MLRILISYYIPNLWQFKYRGVKTLHIFNENCSYTKKYVTWTLLLDPAKLFNYTALASQAYTQSRRL